jgi:hypothetical protein
VLAEAFNDLLGRLEKALAQQRQFMADASLELRTPVSVARSAIVVRLARSGRAEAEYRDSLAVVGEQMRRLSRLVEDMFTLTRADVAPLPLEVERLYLDELVDGCVREARLLDAGRRGGQLTGPQDVEAIGEAPPAPMLEPAGRAVRHAPAGSGAAELAHAGSRDLGQRQRRCTRGRARADSSVVRLDASRGSDGAGLGCDRAGDRRGARRLAGPRGQRPSGSTPGGLPGAQPDRGRHRPFISPLPDSSAKREATCQRVVEAH